MKNENIKTIQKDGYKYFYRIFENGNSENTPIFIFNGFLQDMRSWMRYIKDFNDDALVVIADLPGAGSADVIREGEFRLESFADYVRTIIDETRIGKINIVSASYGASLAYAFAKKYPSKVEHLLVAGVMDKFEVEFKNRIENSVKRLEENKIDEFARMTMDMLMNKNRKENINNFDLIYRIVERQFKNLNLEERKKYAINARHLINHPKLEISLPKEIKKMVITGEFDILTPPDVCRGIAEQLGGCIFTTIKNADHLFHLEQWSTTISVIKKFFKDESIEEVTCINSIEYF